MPGDIAGGSTSRSAAGGSSRATGDGGNGRVTAAAGWVDACARGAGGVGAGSCLGGRWGLGGGVNFDALFLADIGHGAHGGRRIVTADLLNLAAEILVLADGLDVRRVLVGVDSAEEAARRRSDSELSEGDKSRGEDGLGVHSDGSVGY